MSRRLIMAIIAALIALTGLAGALAARAPRRIPIVGSVPIGAPTFGNPGNTAVDSRLGRAYILDNGVHEQQVTLDRNGYSYSSSYSYGGSVPRNNIHVIDTRTGRLVKVIDVPQSVHSLTVDEATGRVFAFDQGQILVLDARSGAPLATVPVSGNPGDLNDQVAVSLVDTRSGRVFATVTQSTGDPVDQHLLLLDGRTGRTLRTLTFAHGAGNTSTGPNGVTSTYYGPSLSLALDSRAGRLYVFNTNRQMNVVDSRSGRILSTRRLPFNMVGATVNGRTGQIFALALRRYQMKNPHFSAWLERPDTVIAFDPRDGRVRRLAPVSGAGMFANTFSFMLDEGSNHVLIADGARRAVGLLDATSGRLVRRVALGAVPLRPLLDAPHHRALIPVFKGYNFMTASTGIAVLDTRTGVLLRTLPMPAGELSYAFGLSLDTGSGHLLAPYAAIGPGPTDRYAWMPGWLRARIPWVPPPPPALAPNVHILTNMVLTIDPS